MTRNQFHTDSDKTISPILSFLNQYKPLEANSAHQKAGSAVYFSHGMRFTGNAMNNQQIVRSTLTLFPPFKGTVSQDFRPSVFFHQTIPPRALIHGLKPFRIWLRICRENRDNFWKYMVSAV
jgi:hypothetical protein